MWSQQMNSLGISTVTSICFSSLNLKPATAGGGKRSRRKVVPVSFVGQHLTEAQAAADGGLVENCVWFPKRCLAVCVTARAGEERAFRRFSQSFLRHTAQLYECLRRRQSVETLMILEHV